MRRMHASGIVGPPKLQQAVTHKVRCDRVNMADALGTQESLKQCELLLVELDAPGTQAARTPIDDCSVRLLDSLKLRVECRDSLWRKLEKSIPFPCKLFLMHGPFGSPFDKLIQGVGTVRIFSPAAHCVSIETFQGSVPACNVLQVSMLLAPANLDPSKLGDPQAHPLSHRQAGLAACERERDS